MISEAFQRDGYVVVEGILSPEEVAMAKEGLETSMKPSSTRGGVVDLFWAQWKLRVTLENEKYAETYKALLRGTYMTNRGLWTHPYDLNGDVYFHVDRVGFRVSTERKMKLSQKGLSPHLDCCPNDMWPHRRWRPIQSLLSLAGGQDPNEGGFECAVGFHNDFHSYYKDRACNCVGDYVAVNAQEDQAILQRFRHIRVPPGAALFWDRRIPHANARLNTSPTTRQVIYGGFLPRGPPENTQYARDQRHRAARGLPQPDFWIDAPTSESPVDLSQLSPFAQHLLGIDEVDD